MPSRRIPRPPAPSPMTYVLNNRLPRFPLLPHYPDAAARRQALDRAFQTWLVERIISNLERRKACSLFYDFAVALAAEGRALERTGPGIFDAWLRERRGGSALPDPGAVFAGGAEAAFRDFLGYARRRLPDLDWQAEEGG